MKKRKNKTKNIKTSNQKLFIENFEAKVKETIEKYDLSRKKDKVLVACSGGKDSTTTLYLLKKFGYSPEALHINLRMGKWSEQNLKNLKIFCNKEKIKLHVFDIRKEIGYGICYLKHVVSEKTTLKQCTICGIVRRWLINKKALQLEATKIATGHNLDDAAQTIMMNWLKGNLFIGINEGPMVGIINEKKFVQRIKPLYFCPEKEVEAYSKAKNFPVLYERCPCVIGAYRHEVRNALNKIEEKIPRTKMNIVMSFLKILPILRENAEKKSIRYCKNCGFPSRNETCKACIIMQKVK